MRILIAPNAFKGSLSVLEAARAFARGATRTHPDAELDLMPIADGGDGVMDCLLAARGGRRVFSSVRGPLGRPVRAALALLADGTACVEMARASGLGLLGLAQRDPMRASTFGSGQLVAAALAKGSRRIVFGLGGTASSDGGAGLGQALGASLLDSRGREIGPGAEGLLALERIDASALRSRLKGVRVTGVTDVVNPLLGARGSAAVYGPQKGASAAQVRLIEKALARLDAVVRRDLGLLLSRRAGAGAAGGCGFGLMAFLGAELRPGAAFVLDACGAAERLKAADAVITGEGRLDATSFYGKAPVELARMAAKAGVPVAIVCGAIDDSARPRLRRLGVRAAVSLSEAGASPVQSMTRAAAWAAKAAALAVKGLALTAALLFAPSLARSHDGTVEATRAIDAAYFHRDQPGNLEKSLALVDEEIARLEKFKEARSILSGFLSQKARSLVRRGETRPNKKDKIADFLAAQAAAQDAVAIDSSTAEYHFWLGVALGRQAQAQGVIKSMLLVKSIRREMQTTLALDPRHGGAHHVLGEILLHTPGFAGGDKKKALEEFETAVRLSPTHSANYPPLIRLYLANGDKDKARALLDRLEALKEPSDPAAFLADLKAAAELRKLL
jgi:glycerate kinase